MTQEVMTPATISHGQIGKLQEIFGASLRKSDLSVPEVQELIETMGGELATALVATVVRYADAANKRVVLCVSLTDSCASPDDMLGTDGGNTIDVVFFKQSRYISDEELEEEYALRNLRHISPELLRHVNAAYTRFVERHPNCTHWKNSYGRWRASFCLPQNDRVLERVYESASRPRYVNLYHPDLWFAGVKA